MKGSRQASGIHALSIVVAAVPFAFGLIRAARTGTDFRYVWVALASLCGAVAIMAVARRHRRRPHAAIALATAVFVGATLLAVLAAWLLGTTLGPGFSWSRLLSASVSQPRVGSIYSREDET